MGLRTSLSVSASLAVLLSGASLLPAVAQETEADEADRRLGAITVTAQRVEENLQDVPVAVTALDTAMLEDKQVGDLLDLQSVVPNINMATNTGTANAARIFLRGVGEDESRGAVDQAVGIYVDGVYVGRSVGSLFDVVDLASIEVLRGPQGTLYGRNTIGGAVKLTSIKPQFENSGEVRTTVGNNGRFDARGTANVQLGENSAFRLTGLLRERDGFHDVIPNGANASERRDDVGSTHIMALRGSFYTEFSPEWSLLVAADQTIDRSDPIPDSVAPGADADDDIFTIEPIPGTVCTPGSTAIGCFTGYDQRSKSAGVSATIKGDIAGLDFTSISAYRSLEDNLVTRIGSPYSQQTDQSQISQEFTLGSSGDVLDWLIGGFYFNEDLSMDSVFIFPHEIDAETESYALFGQGTYSVTDALSLTGGVRFTTETKDFSGANGVLPFSRTDSADYDNVSYTIGADYRFNDAMLGYAKYSTGFKSGGWSPDAFSATAVFLRVDEETLDSFEVGLKTDLFDDKVRINTAAFFNKYEGLQIGATVPGLGFTRFNVDETEIMGLEVEGIWQVTDNFQLNGNLGLLDAEYTDMTGDQARGLTNNGAGCPAGTVAADNAQVIACALGLSLKNAPEYKATLGALYTMSFYDGELIFSGDVSFEDDSWSLVANNPAHALSEIPTLMNARVKYESAQGWSLAVWGKNLSDEEYYRATTAGSFSTYASEPITYGIDLGWKF
ncbi:TonB-dependent receptor [Hyphomonas neptunium ATCC 15444]|uniref:TonB-dependent receptor n=1 Tax=Hyphomonas neptunium (strain ATCC 15444) TaxID=228405 RepID=Q0C355_HYPNA|nr:MULTISPECIES: TonB-dependent receptor [Hyphomonas]ABI77349.1 TonB-dependent receptor [Hyphomonas neptunium ATCC 15444]